MENIDFDYDGAAGVPWVHYDAHSIFLELDFAAAKCGATPPKEPEAAAAPTPPTPPEAAAAPTPDAAQPAAASRDAAAAPIAAAPPPDAPAASSAPPGSEAAKRKVGFGAEESPTAVARRGPGAAVDVDALAPPPAAAHAHAPVAHILDVPTAAVPTVPALEVEAAAATVAAGPMRGGGVGLPIWWGREMGVLM